MRGASRASYAELRDQLGAVAVGPATAEQIGDQLFAVVRLLDSEHGLRRALADSGKPSAEKTAVARRLLHGKVSEATEGLVADAAAGHWATSNDFADALELLAIEALTMAAQYGGDARRPRGRPVQVRPRSLRADRAAGRADRADAPGREDVTAGGPAL